VLTARQATMPGDDRPFVALSVTDHGEGMDEATLARATEPFFTTKGVGKGTGLGLSMVQGMLEQCGGRLVLTSEVGKGTTATIWLPVAEDEPAEHDEEPEAPPPQTRPLRILAVDDDPIVLLNTVTMLEDMGHEVVQARSGAEALELLEAQPFDLLLTDYAMPNMSGGDLVEKVRALRPDTQVIIVSGYADLPEGKAIEAPRLAKPFSDRDLARAVADAAG
jgi:CheY-like chemotaxis protein